MIKYSFIIPTFNRKEYLRITLESLNRLICKKSEEFEVIVVDDGSVDQPLNNIQKIKWNFSLQYVYLTRGEKSCRSRARNYGISIARGEILVFIDSDIIVNKNYLLELNRCFSVSDNIIVAGMRLLLNEEINIENIKNGSFFEKYDKEYNRKEMEEFRHRTFRDLSYNSGAMNFPFLYVQTCNFAVHTECIGILRFDEEFIDWGLEDLEFAYQLYKRGRRIIFNSRIEVFHQFHGKQGNFVENDKINGIINNTKKFLKKHGNIFSLSEKNNIELFKSLATKYKYIENIYDDNKEILFLEYKNSNDFTKFLKIIKETAVNKNLELHIIDYVENDNLDIVIQLLDLRYKNIRYYPFSMKKEDTCMIT